MEKSVSFTLNGKVVTMEVDKERSLLWVLRTDLDLTGTKFGCGIGACGSCTVHIDGKAERSCQTPVHAASGKKVTTIAGLGDRHPVVKAWIKEQVPQCGYCQSGQIMAAVSLLAKKAQPTDADINAAMTNICRCGTYNRVRAAIKAAAAQG